MKREKTCIGWEGLMVVLRDSLGCSRTEDELGRSSYSAQTMRIVSVNQREDRIQESRKCRVGARVAIVVRNGVVAR